MSLSLSRRFARGAAAVVVCAALSLGLSPAAAMNTKKLLPDWPHTPGAASRIDTCRTRAVDAQIAALRLEQVDLDQQRTRQSKIVLHDRAYLEACLAKFGPHSAECSTAEVDLARSESWAKTLDEKAMLVHNRLLDLYKLPPCPHAKAPAKKKPKKAAKRAIGEDNPAYMENYRAPTHAAKPRKHLNSGDSDRPPEMPESEPEH